MRDDAWDQDLVRLLEVIGEKLGRVPDRPAEAAQAGSVGPLVGLVELVGDGALPRIGDLDPYRLGATRSPYGDLKTYGQNDTYVARTNNDVDSRLRTALGEVGRLVLLAGPSKAGKTRTAFEGLKDRWPQARLAAPTPDSLAALVAHPDITGSNDALVVWLDDLQRYITVADPMTPAMITKLGTRPGPTIVVATLRSEERARLRGATGELTRETRALLEQALTLELAPTSADPVEQAAARNAYPTEDLVGHGLGEHLAGAPRLLQRYRDDRQAAPLRYAVVATAIDWNRVGLDRPIREVDLIALAHRSLFADRPDLDSTDTDLAAAIVEVRTAPQGAGRVAALETVPLEDQARGYTLFSYLVAADDDSASPRSLPHSFWKHALDRAEPEDAFDIGFAGFYRDNTDAARLAWTQAADAGHTDSWEALDQCENGGSTPETGDPT